MTLATEGLTVQEISDRRAIETVWTGFWDLFVHINTIPALKRKSLLAGFTEEPLTGEIMKSAKDYDSRGIGNYGTVSHRIYWGPSIDGKADAIVGDCMNTSQFGELDVKTGHRQTQGLARDNMRGVFAKSSAGNWMLTSIELLESQPC